MCRTFIYIAISFAVGIAFGWWLGSLKEPIEIVSEKVRYVEGSSTAINIKEPTPYKVTPLPQLVILHDTVYVRENVNIPIPVDTANIIADYLQKREYLLDFSTDTTGTFKVSAIVEANRLASASATIVPLQREVENTVVKVKKFQPLVSGGIAIGDDVGASLGVGGIIKEKHILSAKYMRIGNGNYYGAEYGYIFGK